MPSLFNRNFSFANVEAFKKLFSNSGQYFYIGLGYQDGDISSTTPTDSFDDEFTVWENLLSLSRVIDGNVRYVTRMYEWTSGTTYTIYEHDATNIMTRDGTSVNPFYVVHNRNVYKCISNNSGSQSVTAPTGQTTSGMIKNDSASQDGYVWKYMYTISTTDNSNFVTTDGDGNKWMPINILEFDDDTATAGGQWDVQTNSIDGSVYHITSTSGTPHSVLTAGGYSDGAAVTIVGDGSGFTGEVATHVSNLSQGASYKYIKITNPGTGYRNASAVKIAGNTISNLKVILSPKGGHGWNASRELGGHNLVVKATFAGLGTGSSTKSSSDTLFVDNDYRQISLIRNPILKTSQYDAIDTGDTSITYGTRSTSSYLDQRIGFTVASIVSGETDIAQYGPDVTVTQLLSGATGKIVNYYTSPNILWVRPISGTFNTGSNLVGTINSVQTTIGVSSLADYDGLRYSGEVMYTENRGLSNREVTTTDDIRIIIKF